MKRTQSKCCDTWACSADHSTMSIASDSWSLRLDAVLRLAQGGAIREAISELTGLVSERSEQPSPHILLATLHRQIGDTPAAMREIDLALELAPGDPNALSVRAHLLMLAQCHAEAEAVARRALERVPGHFPALYDLACALEAQQRWSEA